MKRVLGRAAVGLLLAGCGSEVPPPFAPGPPSADLACSDFASLNLASGSYVVIDSIRPTSCLRFDNTPAGAEYVAVLYSAAATVTAQGATAPYRWLGRSAQAATATTSAPSVDAIPLPDLHDALRRKERQLARSASVTAPAAAPSVPPPIEIGYRRSFGVCADLSCATTTAVATTAAYVGQYVAIMLDDGVAPSAFPGSTLAAMGRMLDEHVFPADTAAFGRESDVDANGLVLLVITNQINRLCYQAGGVVTGYFFGRDLLPEVAGSNGAEVFFALAPDATGTTGCRVTPEFVQRVLPPTFAHELQHMISYHQHVLRRQGPPEETWLNEGLSHLAEELAGRVVPNSYCVANDCFSQFSFNNVSNAYRYLESPEDWHVVFPETSTGRLAERGATFLLTRWLRDHYGNGHSLTRRLLETSLVGSANLRAATGVSFAQLLGEWHLANYLDNLPGFTPSTPRLSYTSWDWRTTFPSLRAQYPQLYSRSIPLAPDSTDGTFTLEGWLRGGSGQFTRVVLKPGAEPADVRIVGADGTPLPSEIRASLAVARIR